MEAFLSILPPLVVLVLGYLTKKSLYALLGGVVVASLIALHGFYPLDLLQFIATKVINNLEVKTFFSRTEFWQTWNLFIFIFLLLLGVIISLIHHSGGAFAYEKLVVKKVKDKKKVEMSSLLLSKLLFFDDYFSSITVGSVMNPVTDIFKIPRVKLAFLVNSLAAPLAILCPFSSWVAAIMGFLKDNGISQEVVASTRIIGSPFMAYLHILPFIFYSFLVIAGVWWVVGRRVSYGLIAQYEKTAEETGNVFNGKSEPMKKIKVDADKFATAHILDFVFPIGTLCICIILGMLFSGEFYLLGGNRTFADALRYSRAASGLFVGGVASFFIITTFYFLRNKVTLKELPGIGWQGVNLMYSSVLILLLAWTLGDILRNDLLTGKHIAAILPEELNLNFLPAVLFVLTAVISLSIGSSWGTIAIMVPISIQMLVSMLNIEGVIRLEEVPLLFPSLGAVFSGAVAGNHISPISDTTVMSATSTNIEVMDHVQTQIPYAIPLFISTGSAFVVLGFFEEPWRFHAQSISLAFGIVCCWGIYTALDINSRVRGEG